MIIFKLYYTLITIDNFGFGACNQRGCIWETVALSYVMYNI